MLLEGTILCFPRSDKSQQHYEYNLICGRWLNNVRLFNCFSPIAHKKFVYFADRCTRHGQISFNFINKHRQHFRHEIKMNWLHATIFLMEIIYDVIRIVLVCSSRCLWPTCWVWRVIIWHLLFSQTF